MEEVVGQESPLEENNLEKLHTCLLGEEGEKEGLFSHTGPLCPLETTDLWLEETMEEQSQAQLLHFQWGLLN